MPLGRNSGETTGSVVIAGVEEFEKAAASELQEPAKVFLSEQTGVCRAFTMLAMPCFPARKRQGTRG